MISWGIILPNMVVSQKKGFPLYRWMELKYWEIPIYKRMMTVGVPPWLRKPPKILGIRLRFGDLPAPSSRGTSIHWKRNIRWVSSGAPKDYTPLTVLTNEPSKKDFKNDPVIQFANLCFWFSKTLGLNLRIILGVTADICWHYWVPDSNIDKYIVSKIDNYIDSKKKIYYTIRYCTCTAVVSTGTLWISSNLRRGTGLPANAPWRALRTRFSEAP